MTKLRIASQIGPHTRAKALTLIELLVVLAIVAVLAALIMPILERGERGTKTSKCMNNLHQINVATIMYAEDHQDAIVLPSGTAGVTDFQLYKKYVKSYAGYNGQASPSEKLFACPSDTFYYSAGNGSGVYHDSGFCQQSFTGFTSYAFNGGNRNGTNYPGIAGMRLSSIRNPTTTLLILEAAAMTPFSWHNPRTASGDYRFFNSQNVASFVDGHASSIKMYFRTNSQSEAWQYNPPDGYDYKWSAD